MERIASHPIRIGLKLSQNAPIESFRRVWAIADEAGFDHCWAFDHLAALGQDGADRVVFEGWTLLAAMAASTRRVRIGLLVTGMVYRHPALLAKQAVTVDHLSGGRLEFGIGAGWTAVEEAMFGIDGTDHRVGRLAEGIEVLKMLWTADRASFEGRHYRLRDAVGIPKPIQKPHPPIWIGAGKPLVLQVAARHADVWNPSGDGLPAALASAEGLRLACRAIGRDPAEIRWAAQFGFDGLDPKALLDDLRLWHKAGFTELIVSCMGPDPVGAAEVVAEQVVAAVRDFT